MRFLWSLTPGIAGYLTLSHVSKAVVGQFESQSNSKDGAEEKAHCKKHRKDEADQRKSRPSHLRRNSPVLPVEDEVSWCATPKATLPASLFHSVTHRSGTEVCCHQKCHRDEEIKYAGYADHVSIMTFMTFAESRGAAPLRMANESCGLFVAQGFDRIEGRGLPRGVDPEDQSNNA